MVTQYLSQKYLIRMMLKMSISWLTKMNKLAAYLGNILWIKLARLFLENPFPDMMINTKFFPLKGRK